MDAASDIGKWVVGGSLAIVVYWLLFAVLVELPGYLVYSLFVAGENDPDNRNDIDPTGRKSKVVGLLLWAVILGLGYGIYVVAK
jgi:hypothetical protein